MSTDRRFLRLARRLEAMYQRRAGQTAERQLQERLAGYRQALEQTRTCLRQSSGGELPPASFALRRHLLRLVYEVKRAAQATLADWPSLQKTVPSLHELLAELHQLEEEFEDVHVDLAAKQLSVTTEAITLEDVYLGPFAIRLSWNDRGPADGELSLAVVALDPQPAAGDEEVTHPHVKEESLCAGDASVALQHALQQGRLADAFCLVQGVLNHYNPRSPYVPLERWTGELCHGCGCDVCTDDLWYCESCGEDYCTDCIGRCERCDAVRCQSCLDTCRVCQLAFCRNCQAARQHDEAPSCQGCHEAAAAERAAEPVASHAVFPSEDAAPAPAGADDPNLTGVVP